MVNVHDTTMHVYPTENGVRMSKPFKPLEAIDGLPWTANLALLPSVVQRVFFNEVFRPHSKADVTVTSLDKPPKVFALQGISKELKPLHEHIKDTMLMAQGTALHDWFERRLMAPICTEETKGGQARWLVEHKLSLKFLLDPGQPDSPENTAHLGGTCDLYDIETRTLYDYKLQNSFKLGKAGKDYSFQLNAYRCLLRECGFPEPEKLCLIEIARDFKDAAKGCVGKMESPIHVEEVPVDKDVTTSLLVDRARAAVIAARRYRAAWKAAKHRKGQMAQEAWALAKSELEPCPGEHTQQWGVLPTGIPRRCLYCPSKEACDAINR